MVRPVVPLIVVSSLSRVVAIILRVPVAVLVLKATVVESLVWMVHLFEVLGLLEELLFLLLATVVRVVAVVEHRLVTVRLLVLMAESSGVVGLSHLLIL